MPEKVDRAPHSLEAEQALLGAMLWEPSALDGVIEGGLEADHFYFDRHQMIFRAMADLYQLGVQTETAAVAEHLNAKKINGRTRLERIGGPAYLAELCDSSATAANADHYTGIIKSRYLLRRMAVAGKRITEAALSEKDAARALDRAEETILEIREGCNSGAGPGRITGRAIAETLRRLNDRAEGRIPLGPPTGLADVDNFLLGLQPGDLTVVAGRPGMGKTAFATRLAINAADPARRDVRTGNRYSVVFFSLEMSEEQMNHRLLSDVSGVPLHKIRSGRDLNDNDYLALSTAATSLMEMPIYFDFEPGLTVNEIRARTRKLKNHLTRQGDDLHLVIVDYLQIIKGASRESREQEIAQISSGLKNTAKKLNLPVIALSQLNRELEKRTDKKPRLSDLRESGAIEQDADVILFLYRPEVYTRAKKDKGKAELLVEKNRQGATGVIPLCWEENRATYRSRTREDGG